MERWYAVASRVNAERSIGKLLENKGFQVFVPACADDRQGAQRLIKTKCLFPGYIFCRFNPRFRMPILTTPGVKNIVAFGGEIAPVDDEEIDSIQRIVIAGASARPRDGVCAGQKVRIIDGPLRGVVGVVTKVAENRKLILAITLLQRSIEVDIDEASVAPAGMEPAYPLAAGFSYQIDSIRNSQI